MAGHLLTYIIMAIKHGMHHKRKGENIMKLTNKLIYGYGQQLQNCFNDDKKLPVKVSFFIQKNKKLILSLVEEIEKARMDILFSYGKLNEDQNSFDIPPDKINDVNNELNDLFGIEQEVSINMIQLSAFDNIELTTKEMMSIMFMIDEEN